MVFVISHAGSAIRFGELVGKIPAHVQTAQAIQTAQQIGMLEVMKTIAVAGGAGGAGGGHEIRLVHGRKKVFTRNVRTLHLKGRHVLLGVGGVKVLKADDGAVFKREEKVVAVSGEFGGIGRKVEDDVPVGHAGNGLRCGGGRLAEKNVSHDTS